MSTQVDGIFPGWADGRFSLAFFPRRRLQLADQVS